MMNSILIPKSNYNNLSIISASDDRKITYWNLLDHKQCRVISGNYPEDNDPLPTFSRITPSFILSQGPFRSVIKEDGRGAYKPALCHIDSIRTMQMLDVLSLTASSQMSLSKFILSGSRDGVIKVWN